MCFPISGGQRPPRPVPPPSRPSGTAWARPGRERRPPRVPAPHKALCPRPARRTRLAATSPRHPRPSSAHADRHCLRDIPAGIGPRDMLTPTYPAAPHRSHTVLYTHPPRTPTPALKTVVIQLGRHWEPQGSLIFVELARQRHGEVHLEGMLWKGEKFAATEIRI